MFYDQYLDDFYLEELFQNYDLDYLKNIDQELFDQIYRLFCSYQIDFMEDIILKYFHIFQMDYELVKKRLFRLKIFLGDDFIFRLGEDLSYLEYIANGS